MGAGDVSRPYPKMSPVVPGRFNSQQSRKIIKRGGRGGPGGGAVQGRGGSRLGVLHLSPPCHKMTTGHRSA